MENFLKWKIHELNIQFSLLRYTNHKVLDIGIKIIQFSFQEEKFNMKISKTGENELLFFTEENEIYNNIIIDNDCYVEFLKVDGEKTFNECFDEINDEILLNLVKRL